MADGSGRSAGVLPLLRRGIGGLSRRTLGLELDELMALGCHIVHEVESRAPAVALTFDDGPSAHSTGRVLDVLEAHDAVATFFLLGANVRRHRRLAAEIARRGHGIGVHGDQHLDYHWTSPWRISRDLRLAKDAIEDAVGCRVVAMRAPFGHFRWDVPRAARRLGLTELIGWSVAPAWSETSAEAITAYVDARVRPGSIVLLHDATGLAAEDAGGCSDAVVASLPGLIGAIRARGLTLTGFTWARAGAAASAAPPEPRA